MKYHKPHFFNDFHCIGSACTDTCCAGWEIEVDETTAEGYLREKGLFGERLRRELGQEPGEYFFRLKQNRCPFLNDRNLCDIFINLGEDRLCDICREHPRFYNWFGDYTEVGLGLCCEEAERLLFSDSRPLTFIEESTKEDPQEEFAEESGEISDDECEQMLTERNILCSILQDRERNMGERLMKLLQLAAPADECEEADRTPAQGAQFLIDLFLDMESLDDTWPSMMRDLGDHLDEIRKGEAAFLSCLKEREYEYEHIAVYLIYRYYPESLFDGLAGEKLLFAVSAVLLLHLLDIRRFQKNGCYTVEDRMELTRRFSKEIEYCPENMERFEECFCEQYKELFYSVKYLSAMYSKKYKEGHFGACNGDSDMLL